MPTAARNDDYGNQLIELVGGAVPRLWPTRCLPDGPSKDSTINLGGTHRPSTNGAPAKLSNEAVKCREYDAVRQVDHNLKIVRGAQAQHIGARAGNRTLNLGIKRRLTFLARKRQDVSGRAPRIRRSDAFVSQGVLACHRVPRVSCQRDRTAPSRSYTARGIEPSMRVPSTPLAI
jgi:hypothetical protein